MTDPSKSPDRHSFQKTGYLQRQADKDESVDESYLDFFEKIINEHEHRWDDPKSRENNLEYDLLTTEWILEKVRNNDVYAQNLYAALCNNEFQKLDVIPILKEETWSCSWRYAGGIIADMQQQGDYIDWYCSGSWNDKKDYVSEGIITDEILEDLQQLKWQVASEYGGGE